MPDSLLPISREETGVSFVVDSEGALRDLADAEDRIVRLNRLDLAVRLKKGEIMKAVRDRALYVQEDYETFEEWVRYSPSMKGEALSHVCELIVLYEVFVQSLGYQPIDLQRQRISYTALRTILPFVERAQDPETGQWVVFNEEAVRGYLDDARHLSAAELRARLRTELTPDANRSLLKFSRVDVIPGNLALVEVEAIDDDAGLNSPARNLQSGGISNEQGTAPPR